jgi:hypothetical protein
VYSNEKQSISDYNTRLNPYNKKALDSLNNLYIEDQQVVEIRTESKQILAQVQSGLNNFSQKMQESKEAFEKVEIR